MILVKIGGGKNVNIDYIAEDIYDLVNQGEKVILVHGASATRDEIASKLGTPTKVITSPSGVSSVFTDQAAMDVFLMVYAGLKNKQIVAQLQSHNVNAVGLSGIDGRLWQAKRKNEVLIKDGTKVKLLKGNLTGRVEKINAELVKLLLDHSYVPVICPPAISFDSVVVNTDNDWAVAVMAGVLEIKEIVVLFEAPGLLRNPKDESSVIKRISQKELTDSLDFAQGRMKKKVLGAQKAFALGVKKIYWGDGRIKHPVREAREGKGTVIKS